MWFSTFISKFYPDRVQIPPNIGNNIFIGNNQIVTKYSISSMVVLEELSDTTPVALTSEVIKAVKNAVPGVYVDVTFKNQNYYPDLGAQGLQSRIRQWVNTVNNKNLSERSRKRAARLLYTVDIARRRHRLFRTQVYFIIRAQNGLQLRQAQKVLESKIDGYKISYRPIKSKVIDHLKYTSLVSNKSGETARDIPTLITSSTVLAEMLPTIMGMNDEKGNYLGLNLFNYSPYNINFRATRKAKNIYVLGLSGHGKTFLVINWALDAYAIGYNICASDLKGNEFVPMTHCVGGVVISLRPESPLYINTLKFNKNEIREGNHKVYYNTRISYTRNMLMYAAMPNKEDVPMVETLVKEFLASYYATAGVLRDNPNTWYRTGNMHPLHLYDAFNKFLSKAHIAKYGVVAERLLDRFKDYFHPSGTNSHMFGKEIDLQYAYSTKMLTFDFGMLNTEGVVDVAAFQIRQQFMDIMNDGYVLHNMQKGEWTYRILEESQIAGEEGLERYAKEFSLRRAQQQVTVMLGNSVTALMESKAASTIIDNINILALGVINKRGRDFVIDEFGLNKHKGLIDDIAENPDYENQFLLVNKMQKHSTTALIKAFVPAHIAGKRLFTTIKTEDD